MFTVRTIDFFKVDLASLRITRIFCPEISLENAKVNLRLHLFIYRIKVQIDKRNSFFTNNNIRYWETEHWGEHFVKGTIINTNSEGKGSSEVIEFKCVSLQICQFPSKNHRRRNSETMKSIPELKRFTSIHHQLSDAFEKPYL